MEHQAKREARFNGDRRIDRLTASLSSSGGTADMLQDTSRWFLRDTTLKAANTILVD